MTIVAELWRRLVLFMRREHHARDLEDELRSHVAMRAQGNVDRGMTPDDAAVAARRTFGNATAAAEASRDAWGGVWLEQRLQDLRIAARSLRRTPGFAIAAVLTLALGIGAATSVFSVAYGILIAPLPLRDPANIVVMWGHNPTNQPEHFPLSGVEYQAFARQARSFAIIGALDYHGALPRLVQFGDTAVAVRVAMVTGDFFPVLGARPLLGRLLRPDDDRYGAQFAMVLSEGFWRRALGGDASVVGRTAKINTKDVTIIGVAAGGLDYPQGAEMWASYPAFFPAKDTLNGFYDVVARLRAGATTSDAANELGAFLKRPEEPHSGARLLLGNLLRPVALPIVDAIVGDVRPAVRIVAGSVALLLLVTCLNIANLLLVRTVARRREFAVRAALGAGRGRIAQQVFAESAVLSALGGMLGIACAWFAVRAFVLLAPAGFPRGNEIAMSAPALTAAVAISVGVALLFGCIPAIASGQLSVAGNLHERRVGESSPTTQRTRTLLVGVQVAVAVAALVGAGVVVRSFEALAHVDLGFVPDKLVIARFGAARMIAPAEVSPAVEAAISRVRTVPGVTHATGLLVPPFRATGNDLAYSLPGDTPGAATHRPLADYLGADGDYFQTLGISLRRGRLLTDDDRAGGALVAVVDELLARQAWPGENPIAKRIGVGDTYYTVVGVVGPTRYRDVLAPRATLYVTYPQALMTPGYLAVRAEGDPVAVITAVRAAVRAQDPRLFVADVTTLSQRVDGTLAQPRLDASLLGGFAVAILLLTGIGLYSVAATFVRQREFELSVRLALGAAPSQVVRLVLREGAEIIAVGTAAGVVGAMFGSGALSSILFGVSARDPLAFGAAIALVAGVAAIAFMIPARRASRANPSDVLRAG